MSMFNRIQAKVIAALPPKEVLREVNDHVCLGAKMDLNLILYRLIKKIQQIHLPTEEEVDEIKVDSFIKGLEAIAAAIKAARTDVMKIDESKRHLRKVDLYLQTLQLNLQNYRYYQSIGIDFFANDSRTGLATTASYSCMEYIGMPALFNTMKDNKADLSSACANYITDEIINEIKEFTIVYITAPNPNPYGHVLLGLGDKGYIHINALYDRPQYIPVEAFNDYLNEQGRVVLGVQQVYVPDMKKAREKLSELCHQSWLWRLYWNNCVSFADTVLHAGGVGYAELDPFHIGDYHGYQQLPIERICYVNDHALNKEKFDTLDINQKRKVMSQGLAEPLKKEYEEAAKYLGFDQGQTKKYVYCRMHEGLSHERAQYETKPSWLNFFVMHQEKLGASVIIHPLLFVLAMPILFVTTVKTVLFHSHMFFIEKRQKENPDKHETEPPVALRT